MSSPYQLWVMCHRHQDAKRRAETEFEETSIQVEAFRKVSGTMMSTRQQLITVPKYNPCFNCNLKENVYPNETSNKDRNPQSFMIQVSEFCYF